MANRIELGDEVTDRATGYRGIACSRTRWLTGCDRIGVNALGKQGNVIYEVFDEPMLDVHHSGKVAKAPASGTGVG